MKHYENLDGLRGIAALVVAVHHFLYYIVPKEPLNVFVNNYDPNILQKVLILLKFGLLKFFFAFCNGGLLPVIVFFILSGYVLTIPYYNDDLQTIKSRLCGRYIRLNIPIMVSIVVAFFMYKQGLFDYVAVLHDRGLKYFFPADINTLSVIKIFLYEAIFNGNTTFNGPLWTLNIEFIGSIFLLTYYAIKPTKHTILTAIFVCFFLYVLFKKNSIYYIAIICGSLLVNKTFTLNLKRTAIALFFILFFSSFIFDDIILGFLPKVHVWEQRTFYGTLSALSLVVAIKSGFGDRFLKSYIIQYFGKISYSLYIIHFLIMSSISCYLYAILPKTEYYILANFMIYLLILFGASSLFEKFIDRPAIFYSHAFGNWLYK